MMKRWIAVSAALLLLLAPLSLCPAAAGGESAAAQEAQTAVHVTGGDQPVLQTAEHQLYVDPSTGAVRVVGRADGFEWRSNPGQAENDPVARNVFRTNLRSQLYIEYLDENDRLKELNSWAGCVADGNLSVQKAGDLLLCNYYFAAPELNVPVIYRLLEDGLEVTLDYAHVIEKGACRLTKISLLPYFGAGGSGEEGCLLLPDGSGTVVEFNNKRHALGGITLDVYGGNSALNETLSREQTQPCLFPGFGIIRGGRGMLAVAERGEGEARLTGMVAGKETSYNHAYFTFAYRHYDTITMLDRTWAATEKIMSSAACASPAGAAVTFRFIDEGTLGGLAAIGREYFASLGMESVIPETTALYLDVYHGVEVTKHFLGVSYRALRVLTDFEQTAAMLDELSARGVADFRVRMNGVDDGGAYYGKIDSRLRFASSLGGMDGYRRLRERYGDVFSPKVQLTEFTRDGNGIYAFLHSVNGITTKTVKRHTPKVTTGVEDSSLPARHLLRPQKVEDAVKSLLKDLQRQEITALAPDSLGNRLYSSFSGDTSQIGDTKARFTALLEALSGQSALLLEAPNSYAIPYAQSILALPATHSGYYMSSYAVPFLQMMLGPYVAYSAPPANRMSDRTDRLLTALETGSMPCFTVMQADFREVEQTPLDYLYASGYDDWKEEMVWLYTQLSDLYARTGHSTIADCRVTAQGVRSLLLDNGMTLYVNRSAQPYDSEDGRVPAGGYLLAPAKAG